jgi:hypothetical protein
MTGVLDVSRSLIGIAWGTLAALPLLRAARRADVVLRAPRRVPSRPAAFVRFSSRARHALERVTAATGPLGRVARGVLATRQSHAARRALERELPITLDLLAVAVGAGCTPYLAVDVASRWAPPAAAASFSSVIVACSIGECFAIALDDAASATPPLRPLADALLSAERLGAPIEPALGRLAAEERASLRRRAEAHARRIPVRLLFPLVFLVLPAFVLLTVVPGLAAGLARL